MNYGALEKKLNSLSWEYRLDEDHIESDYIGTPEQYLTDKDFLADKKGFNKTMKKPHRTTELANGLKYYSFKKGDVWLGG